MKNRGFTLIETLIAITILIMAVTGAFAAAQNGLSSAVFSKDQVIAFYLAQEGVEFVRNARDENGLSSSCNGSACWLNGIASGPGDPCYSGACKVDPLQGSGQITSCNGDCPVLKLDSNGFYTYSNSNNTTPTIFTRTIIVTRLSDHEARISSTVSWSKGLIPRQFTATENIFNWQK